MARDCSVDGMEITNVFKSFHKKDKKKREKKTNKQTKPKQKNFYWRSDILDKGGLILVIVVYKFYPVKPKYTLVTYVLYS